MENSQLQENNQQQQNPLKNRLYFNYLRNVNEIKQRDHVKNNSLFLPKITQKRGNDEVTQNLSLNNGKFIIQKQLKQQLQQNSRNLQSSKILKQQISTDLNQNRLSYLNFSKASGSISQLNSVINRANVSDQQLDGIYSRRKIPKQSYQIEDQLHNISGIQSDTYIDNSLYQFRNDILQDLGEPMNSVKQHISFKQKEKYEDMSLFEFIQKIKIDPKMKDEFCYLNRRGHAYDFYIVEFNKVNQKEYLTISIRGITHVKDGESDFISTDQWFTESKQFDKIKKIYFFQIYKLWKNFYIWRKFTRKNAMKKSQNILIKNLFLIDPILSQSLVKINKLSYKITKLEFFNYQIYQNMYIEKFQQFQEEFRETVMIYNINKLLIEIQKLVFQSCKTSLKDFKTKHRIPQQGVKTQPLLIGDESKKKMPYTKEATIKTHQQKLKNYVKLIDQIVIKARLDMIKNSVNKLSSVLQNFTKKQKETSQITPWIICNLTVNDNELEFYPDIGMVQNIFDEILKTGTELICKQHKSFIFDSDIQEIIDIEVFEEDFISPMTIVEFDNSFERTFLNFKRVCFDSIGILQKYFEFINPYMNMYIENKNIQQLPNEINIEKFQELIWKYQNQDSKLQTIESKYEIGIFVINSSQFKELIKNCAQIYLESLQFQIPEILNLQTNEYLQLTTEINNKLNWNIHDNSNNFVEYFVQYNEHVQKSIQFDLNQSTHIEQLNLLLKLIQDNKFKLHESCKIKILEINSYIISIRQKIEDSLAEYDQNLSKSANKLKKQDPEFIEKLRRIENNLYEPFLQDKDSNVQQAVNYLKEQEINIQNLQEQISKTNIQQQALGFEVIRYEKLQQIDVYHRIQTQLWQGILEFQQNQQYLENIQFLKLDFQYMDSIYQKLKKTQNLCQNHLDQSDVNAMFKQELQQYSLILETLRSLLDPALLSKQWDQIRALCLEQLKNIENPFSQINSDEYTYKYIQNSGITQLKDQLIDIALQARKEIEFIRLVDQIEIFWIDSKFQIKPYKNQSDNYILCSNQEIITVIEENLITLNNICATRYIEGIRGRVNNQIEMFQSLQVLIDEWMLHQKNYIYLEPILNNNAGQLGLQKESSIFKKAEKGWKNMMRRSKDYPHCKSWVDESTKKQFLILLKQNNKSFEQIQKALDDFLEKKREHFQRFFFLSNSEFLEFLSTTKSPVQILPHLRKVFDNLVNLTLDDENIQALSMISAEGEDVPLKNCILRSQEMEEIMGFIQDSMINTLKSSIKMSFLTYENYEKKVWVLKNPCQVSLTVDSIHWSRNAEELYLYNETDQREDNNDFEIGRLDDYCIKIILDLEDSIQQIRGNLNHIQRITLMAMVTQNVNQRDIIQDMFEQNIKHQSDFQWLQQFKFYWDDEVLTAKMVNSSLNYSYEYLGAYSRLVITPLTQKCWLTITSAFQNKLGANPAGPAGTGKTESCKDMAKLLGRYCIVFNCSEQNTSKMMERLFIGLISTGCWICLDEFNRIDVEVLSVVASQILYIKEASLEQRYQFTFFGKTVTLNQNYGLFVTFNPGYSGRSELPDNLKLLFRPIAMVVPNYKSIAENLLYSYGFNNGLQIGNKISVLYKLASECLSNQDHYDFGMRSLKSVIIRAGHLKRIQPYANENDLIITAIQDCIIPVFITSDTPMFYQLLTDIFPGLSVKKNYLENENTFDQDLKDMKLQKNDNLLIKVNQFKNMVKIRFGLILVGVSQCGKSTIINLLKNHYQRTYYDIQNEQQEPKLIETFTINPKAIDIQQLYGYVDAVTQSWIDGLGSKTLRQQTINPKQNTEYWTIFDGPVDPFWCENMNTVLDDSKVLCLSNGERIKLHENMKIIFECENLQSISPATISRCGIIYIQDHMVQMNNLVDTFFDTQLDFKADIIFSLKNTIKEVLTFIEPTYQNYQFPIRSSRISTITKTLNILSTFFEDKNLIICFKSNSENNTRKAIMKLSYYCICWGFGSHLLDDQQQLFNQEINKLFQIIDQPKGLVFDYYLSFKQKNEGEYLLFQDQIPQFQYSKEKSFYDIIVPTKEIALFQYILNKLISKDQNLFMTGSTGIGKSVILNYSIKFLQNVIVQKIQFSNQINVKQIQSQVELRLQTQRRKGLNVLIPPVGKKLILQIDDINMSKKEIYGSQPPIEFLRQLLDQKGVFDIQGLAFKEVEDTILLTIGAYPGGARTDLTPRFTRHFNIINISKTSEFTIMTIYSQIMVGFLKASSFKSELIQMIDSMIKGSLMLLERCSQFFLPSIQKPHYIFSLRDMSKIFQGMFLASPITILNKTYFLKLWIHECMRVFHDKLVTDNDQAFIIQNITQTYQSLFNEKLENIDEIYQVDFLHRQMGYDKIMYEFCKDKEKMIQTMHDIMKEESPIQIILFKQAVNQIIRIIRIMRLQVGHMILIGEGGSGKKSMIQLASVIANVELFTIQETQKYNKAQFHNDLVALLFKVGLQNLRMVFLFNEKQLLINESFLEDINNLIMTGEAIGALNKEDMDKINEELATDASKLQIDTYDLFVQRIKKNLHIIITMSPLSDTVRQKFRLYPTLISYCTINWILPWPSEALFQVANIFLKDSNQQILNESEQRVISKLFVFGHVNVLENSLQFYEQKKRKVYITSKNYLELVKYYIDVSQTQKDQILIQKNKLVNGLNKLQEANNTISQLKIKLVDLQPILIQKTIYIKDLISKLTQDQLQANMVKKVVEAEANEINIQSEKILILKGEADIILKEAYPIFQNAIEQLDKLNRSDISEIKANNNPHNLIKFAVECVAILLEEKTDWDHIRKVILGDATLLNKLKNLKCELITQQTKDKIKKKLLSNPLFVPSEMKNINMAAKSLCDWVHAVNNFTDIYKEISVKKENCKQMDTDLQTANSQLQVKQQELESVIKKVQELEKVYSDSKSEKESLDNEIKQTEERLHRASQLTEGLSEEQIRWKEKVLQLNIDLDVNLGDCLLSSFNISYYGPFTGQFRETMIKSVTEQCFKHKILTSAKYSLSQNMSNQLEIETWIQNGLASDSISINNGILVQNSINFPMIIDPQMQAVKWIKKLEHENSIFAIKMTDDNLLKYLQECIQLGKPFFIEEVEEIVPQILEPLLKKQFFYNNHKNYIRLGDEEIEYNEKFKLYMACKHFNPHFNPQTFVLLSIINFTVTEEGLLEKLLSDVVSLESPQDDKLLKEIILSISDDKLLLKQGEDKILDLLTSSRGMILDDIELIESLKISKEIAKAVNDKLVVSLKKEEEINKELENYYQVAQRGTNLYFLISDLYLIDPMYQYSLSYFLIIYCEVIRKTVTVTNRIEHIVQSLTYTVFSNICNSLFNKHKKVFAFMLASLIQVNEKKNVDPRELQFLIINLPKSQQEQNPPALFENYYDQWQQLLHLRNILDYYIQIIRDIEKSPELWFEYFTSPNIANIQTPKEIGNFQKLLLITLFQPQQKLNAIDKYIKDELDETYVNITQSKLEHIYSFMNYYTPLIILMQPGQDPIDEYKQFAIDQNIHSENNFIVSLGQGQQQIAQYSIQQAMKNGGWVLLQNCHLGRSFMTDLERQLDHLNDPIMAQEIDQNFRIFLTTQPFDSFPMAVLQNSIKITSQLPGGIKNIMAKKFDALTEDQMEISENQKIKFHKLLYSLTMFHSVIIERGKYGSIGFANLYNFNDADLETAFLILRNLLDFYQDIPWDALTYMIGNVVYGGKVTDQWDSRIVFNTLEQFCNQNILLDNHKFVDQEQYVSAIPGLIQNYQDQIQNLPDEDYPEIFGLSQNANFKFQLDQISFLDQTIKLLLPKKNKTEKVNNDQQIWNQILTIEKKIPNLLQNQENNQTFDIMNSFFYKEVFRFNRLIMYMNKTLIQLKMAILGEVLMSPELELMQEQIANNQFPAIWASLSYPNLKSLLSWMEDFILKVAYLANWQQNGIPKSIWLSVFFFPQGFLTTILQQYARIQKLPLERTTFQFKVMNSVLPENLTHNIESGFLIHGLYTEGFKFESTGSLLYMRENKDNILYLPAPIINFLPSHDFNTSGQNVLSPLYKIVSRQGTLSTTGQSTNFIIGVQLISQISTYFWVLKGAALFCSLPY